MIKNKLKCKSCSVEEIKIFSSWCCQYWVDRFALSLIEENND